MHLYLDGNSLRVRAKPFDTLQECMAAKQAGRVNMAQGGEAMDLEESNAAGSAGPSAGDGGIVVERSTTYRQSDPEASSLAGPAEVPGPAAAAPASEKNPAPCRGTPKRQKRPQVHLLLAQCGRDRRHRLPRTALSPICTTAYESSRSLRGARRHNAGAALDRRSSSKQTEKPKKPTWKHVERS